MSRSPELEQFYADIISTAVEGGTNYWAQVSQYQYLMDGEICVCVGDRQKSGAQATLHPLKDDESGYEEKGLVVTTNTIAHAFQVLRDAEEHPFPNWKGEDEFVLANKKGERLYLAQRWADEYLRALRHKEAGDLDSGDCDNLVQLGLFDKVVYG